jgi:D-alanyl-D-alanine carboxypeptidase
VVMGGRSAGSRDATMRSLLAENLDRAATIRTAAAITEHNVADNAADASNDVPEARATSRQAAAADPAVQAPAPASASRIALLAQATAAVPPTRPRIDPAPLTSGVIQTQPMAVIPGSSEPMRPVRVKTVQVKAGPLHLASAASSQSAPPVTSAIQSMRTDVAETSNAMVARAEGGNGRPETARSELPPQPPGFGTGNGILGVLPASSRPSSSPSQQVAYAAPTASQPEQNAANKASVVHTGWIIQVGALDSESEARERIETARDHAHGLLAKADPFTEPVIGKGDHKLYRARFAGLDRDQAEAVCRRLKHSDISCITLRD